MRAIYAEAGRVTSVGFRFIRRWLWTSGHGPKPPPTPEPPATRLFTLTFPIQASDADTAWRVLRRDFRNTPPAELEQRAHTEEVIGDPTLDEGMTARQVRKLLRRLA